VFLAAINSSAARKRHYRGKKDLVEKVRRHPLFRALRVDKLTICALEATLGAYLRGASEEIPAVRMLRASPTDLARRADNFLKGLKAQLPASGTKIESSKENLLPAEARRQRRVFARRYFTFAANTTRLLILSAAFAVRWRELCHRSHRRRHVVVDLRTVFADQEPELAALWLPHSAEAHLLIFMI